MRQIGNYTVEEVPIGSGGMGHVLRGYDTNGVPVAIKQILPNFVANIEYRSRIEREIEFLKKLNNDHVVRIYDHFEGEGNLFIVMEYVEGLNIEQYVAKYGAIPWQEAINYMVQLLMTMQDVHAHGIVHRDIKPGNIMIRPNGQICLLDFGVAKDTSSQVGHGGTVFGTVIGTDGYMSPEQAQGFSIDHRSDIYGLGCVLYFMLTGTHAFGSEHSELKMQIAITCGKFPSLSGKVKGIPEKLQKALDNAVNKNMIERYQSCKEFANDLSSLLGGGTQIDTINQVNPLSVSVGRENCDILVGSDNRKVSRHHADIVLKRFTGGEFYVYTDCSSNGTIIDGNRLQKGMSFNIPKGSYPTILLAGDPSCRLDIKDLAAVLDKKVRASEDTGKSDIHGGKSRNTHDGYNPIPGGTSVPRAGKGMFSAVATCFRKYIDFSGRASRSEYWWFWLFNILMCGIFVAVAVPLQLLEMYILLCVYQVVILLPSLAVMIRRLHDTGRNWLFILLPLIPLVGEIVLIVFLASKGQPNMNRFGPPPVYKRK